MPSLYLLLPDCEQDPVPKATKAGFAGPFYRFLNLPCKAQKPLLLLALHHEKLLLFPGYILRVITGVNTKWNTKIELHEKILSSSSGYSKVVFLGVCSGLLLPCKTLIQFFNGPCF